MAQRQSGSARTGVLGDIEGWLSNRESEARKLASNAERTGGAAWDQATGFGQNRFVIRPDDVVAIRGLLGLDSPRNGSLPGSTGSNIQTTGARTDSPTPAGPQGRQGVGYSQPPDLLDSASKALAGDLAGSAGIEVGKARGAVHSVEGIVDGLSFLSRLLDPYDAEDSPRGEAAWDKVIGAGKGALQYAENGVSRPESVAQDVGDWAVRSYMGLNPYATPVAASVPEGLGRRFNIGQNQGEALFDLASLFVGGAAAKSLESVSASAELGNTAKYLAQGFSPEDAEYLAGPYIGMGHHNVPRSYTVPETLAGLPIPRAIAGRPLPRAISDSPFNVLRVPGMSRGDFYQLHFQVDPHFHGTELPSGARWSGKDLGFEKFGPLGQIWFGPPLALKAAVATTAGGAGASSTAYGAVHGERGQ